MEYSKLISVTGLNGLFELVGSKTDGAIVRSLDDSSLTNP
jgi:inhibitor of KinA sporulation pathway (predicted exonuclease)